MSVVISELGVLKIFADHGIGMRKKAVDEQYLLMAWQLIRHTTLRFCFLSAIRRWNAKIHFLAMFSFVLLCV